MHSEVMAASLRTVSEACQSKCKPSPPSAVGVRREGVQARQ